MDINSISENKCKERLYPELGACGLNCGLCPHYHTEGKSKCYGCGSNKSSIFALSCGTNKCASMNECNYCYECHNYPCSRYKNALNDSFVTHQNIYRNFQEIERIGLDKYQEILDEKISILKYLLKEMNDGRRKSFYCLVVNLLDIEDTREIMKKIYAFNDENELNQEIDKKSKIAYCVSLFKQKANEKNISLILNSKTRKNDKIAKNMKK